MPHSGIALSNIDHSVRPQDDLYQHVNGAWLKSTTIPDDRPLEGTFTALRDGAELAVREIIEEAAGKGAEASGIERKIGDLYNSFMDEAAVEAKGMDPIRGPAGRGVRHDHGRRARGPGRQAVPRGRVRPLLHLPCPGRRKPGPGPALHRPGRARAPGRVLLPRRKVRPDGAGLPRVRRHHVRPGRRRRTRTAPPPGWSPWKRPSPRTTGTTSRCGIRRRPTT